jgi:hypothetical protein
VINGRACPSCDPIARLRPSLKPPLSIAGADALDRLEDLGRIGPVSRNIVQHAQCLKVVGLIGEKLTPANVATSAHVHLLVAHASEQRLSGGVDA